MCKYIDVINVKNLSLNSIGSNIIAMLGTSNRQKWANLDYKVDTGSEVNLIPLNIFEVLFL